MAPCSSPKPGTVFGARAPVLRSRVSRSKSKARKFLRSAQRPGIDSSRLKLERDMSDCLFCGIINGSIKADIVYRDETVLAFKDIVPRAPVHILIIPVAHIAMLSD